VLNRLLDLERVVEVRLNLQRLVPLLVVVLSSSSTIVSFLPRLSVLYWYPGHGKPPPRGVKRPPPPPAAQAGQIVRCKGYLF